LIIQRYNLEKVQAVYLQVNNTSPHDTGFLQSALGEMLKLVQISQNHNPQNEPPPARVSEAFELYCEKIAFRDLINKSKNQKKRWYLGKNNTQQLYHCCG